MSSSEVNKLHCLCMVAPHLCVLFYNCVWLNSKCNTVANCSQTNKMRSTTLALPLPVPVLVFGCGAGGTASTAVWRPVARVEAPRSPLPLLPVLL